VSFHIADNTGPQGLAGHQVVTRCCAYCTHFYVELIGHQSHFYGRCNTLPRGSVAVIMSLSDTEAKNTCLDFNPRPLEELVAEKLAGTWLGKWR